MFTVNIEEDDLLEMLCDRLAFWVEDTTSNEYKAWECWYEHLIESGEFDCANLDIMNIVDNDYVNCYNYYETMEDIENDFPDGREEYDIFKCEFGYIVCCC